MVEKTAQDNALGWQALAAILAGAALAAAGCCPPPKVLGEMAIENDLLRRENLFLRRHLGPGALGLLMRDFHDWLEVMKDSLEDGRVASVQTRFLVREIPLVPSLAGSLPMDEKQRKAIRELTDRALESARVLNDPGTQVNREKMLTHLRALELSCVACHVEFGGPRELSRWDAGGGGAR